MGDRNDNDPIQDIIDELDRIRTREQELIVQLSGFVRTGFPPAPPCAADPPAQPRIRLRFRANPPAPRPNPVRLRLIPPQVPIPGERNFVLDSLGNRLQTGDLVRFTASARHPEGVGRVTGWTAPLAVPDPFIYITRDVPRGVRHIGCRDLVRKSHNVTLIRRRGS